MNKSIISIFGNKIFLEIINEIKLLPKFEIKHYENFDLCLKNARNENLLTIFFLNNSTFNFFKKNKINSFPSILVTDFSTPKNLLSSELVEQLNMPFTILEFEKKVVSLIAKNEFKKNSLIQLYNYVIDKNERKIKRDNLELQL